MHLLKCNASIQHQPNIKKTKQTFWEVGKWRKKRRG